MSNHYIPYDVVYCILALSSVKNLMKLKCVSKLWLTTIQSSEFVQFHSINYSKSHTMLICGNLQWDSHVVGFLPFPICGNLQWDSRVVGFLPFPEMFRGDQKSKSPKQIQCPRLFYEKSNVVGTSRGIICIQYTKGSGVYLYNPWIKQYRKLPRFYLGRFPEKRHWLYNVYGFGYDELHDDFKVVKLSGVGSNIQWVIFTNVGQIYSLKSNKWQSIENIPHIIHKGKTGFFFNHCLHWLFAYHRESFLSIDIRTGKHTLLPLPNDLRYDINLKYMDLVEFTNCLSMFKGVINGFEIWLMKEYGVKDSWTKLKVFVPVESLSAGSTLKMYTKNENEEYLVFTFLGVPYLFDFTEQKLYSKENAVAKNYFFATESLVSLYTTDNSARKCISNRSSSYKRKRT